MTDQTNHATMAVWGARGGHGATTIAGALGVFLQANVVGAEPWAIDWLFTPRPPARDGSGFVVDAGAIQRDSKTIGTSIVVLRGPCSLALKTLVPMAGTIDNLVVIREPWRNITNEEVEAVLSRPVAAEVAFSERVARLADAGLLGLRLDRLTEFQELRLWAAGQVTESELPRLAG